MYSGLGWSEEGDGIGNFYPPKPQEEAQPQQLGIEHTGVAAIHHQTAALHAAHAAAANHHAAASHHAAAANHHAAAAAVHHGHAASQPHQHQETHLNATPPPSPHSTGHTSHANNHTPLNHHTADQPHGQSTMRAQFSSLFENCASSMAQSTPDPDGLEKDSQMEQRSKSGDDRAKWSDPARLKFLLRGYMGSIKEGKVTPFGLKKSQWNEILGAFNEVFEIQHSVEQLKNGFGNLKRQFKDTTFLRGLPGWCWHEKEKAVYNSPEAWTEAIKKFPFRNLSRLIGVRTNEMWSSKSLELYCGMFDDLQVICSNLSCEREDIMVFSELVALSKGPGEKERTNEPPNKTAPSRKRDRPGGELVTDHGEPPTKHSKHDRSKEEQILSVLDEMKAILSESQKKPEGPALAGPGANLQQAISEMMPFKNQLGRDFGRGLLLMKDEGNATIFLNLDYEDRLNFIFTLLRAPAHFPAPLLPQSQENSQQQTGSSA